MQVQRVPIDSISPDPANLNLHPPESIERIKASLRRFKQQKPIVVNRDGVIVAGNGTWQAAKQLKWAEIDVVTTDLSGAELVAFGIADNRTSEFSLYDEPALAEALRALQAEDAGLLDAAGFDDADVDELFERLAEEADGDALEPEPPPATEEVSFTATESQVRMVQLFLTVGTFPRFQEMVEALGARYGTTNATDTVMAALERETSA